MKFLICLIFFPALFFSLAIRAAEPTPTPGLKPGETFTIQFPGN